MRFIADLHVHSRFSRATSPHMRPEGLARWAALKGIGVLGTGDFTHPEWLRELQDALVPAEPGLYRLRDAEGLDVPDSCRTDVRFLYQAEISCIYKRAGKTRKVHSVVLAPGWKEATEISRRLGRLGNVTSDGRPILGLDTEKLLQLVLDVSADAMLVPAHAWTPHFSVFGSVSGFDSLEECFGNLTPHIRAIETGLSSDPPMNRRLSALDGLTLISNSDAHSPSKLGREANVLDTGMSYHDIANAIKTGKGFEGTIEFFPEEGKYHVDGHRKCGISMEPGETVKHGFKCPACGRKMTVGVLHRVEALADRDEPKAENFRHIIPLAEIIAECMGRGVNTKGVQGRYIEVLSALGPEFTVLLDTPLPDIERAGGEMLARAIGKMRQGDVYVEPGYDGEFGVVRVFKKNPVDKKTSRKPPGRPAKRPKGKLF